MSQTPLDETFKNSHSQIEPKVLGPWHWISENETIMSLRKDFLSNFTKTMCSLRTTCLSNPVGTAGFTKENVKFSKFFRVEDLE